MEARARCGEVLVAPDKFKGTYTAGEVAEALVRGVRGAGATATALPVADGGDGTAEAIRRAVGGRRVRCRAHDALGRPIVASFVLLADGRAVVDVAEASGLGRLAPDERDAIGATSRGTGELIAEAIARGAHEVLVAAGGSASTDGGRGALDALAVAGVRPHITVICDVDVPFEACAHVFGPQKGAGRREVEHLERRLAALAGGARRDPRGRPMTGAAGGLAGGLWAELDARLVHGSSFVLDAIGFDGLLGAARLVLTGEGCLDVQTAHGKAVSEVARRARAAGIPAAAVVGRDALGSVGALALGLHTVVQAGDPQAIAAAGRRLAGLLLPPR